MVLRPTLELVFRNLDTRPVIVSRMAEPEQIGLARRGSTALVYEREFAGERPMSGRALWVTAEPNAYFQVIPPGESVRRGAPKLLLLLRRGRRKVPTGTYEARIAMDAWRARDWSAWGRLLRGRLVSEPFVVEVVAPTGKEPECQGAPLLLVR